MSDAPSLRYLQQLWMNEEKDLNLVNQEGLGVYRRAYWLRLLESLEDDFPRLKEALHKVTGDQGFEELLKSYLVQHPPQGYSLSQVGARVEHYLKETLPWSSHPELADYARLDWLEFRAWNAPHVDPVSVATLNIWAHASEEKLERLTLEFQPAMALFCSMEGATPTLAVVYRNEQEAFVDEISAEEFTLLELARDGATLQELAQELERAAANESQAIEWAADWMSRGLVIGLTLKPSTPHKETIP